MSERPIPLSESTEQVDPGLESLDDVPRKRNPRDPDWPEVRQQGPEVKQQGPGEPPKPEVIQQQVEEPQQPELSQQQAEEPSGPKPSMPVSGYLPPSPGYISDYVDPASNPGDRLDIKGEVSTIAHVMLSKQVTPPLALGLFGDWGSGKSFFMTKLRRRVESGAAYYRDQERRTGEVSPWCSRVVQICFNAWHYADANLWASLVTRIYDSLDQELSDKRTTDQELRQRLSEEIQSAQGMVRKAKEELGLAQKRLQLARAAFLEAQEKRRQEEEKLSGLVGDVQTLLVEDRNLPGQLQRAAAALGYPEAATSYDALVELNASLKSLSGRAAALSVNLIQASSWTLLILVLLIVALPLGAGFLFRQFGDQLSQLGLGQQVAEVGAFIFGLVAWLKVQMGRGLKLVSDVEKALNEARRVRQTRLIESDQAQEAQQNLSVAETEEQVARENLQTMQADLQRLKAEKEELRPERRLYRLLLERTRSGAYSQHLGIITLIRTDFEQISNILADMARKKRDLKEAPPIQRIILYIDDLDRCRPERVVEVLEAVHMLLAFPLFVVVVGVDPRWLRHSLSHHYSQTLTENGVPAQLDGQAGPALYSTPQDYLEKIFQIPFAVRPMGQNGYANLVADLLREPETARDRSGYSPDAGTDTGPPPDSGVGRASIGQPPGGPVSVPATNGGDQVSTGGESIVGTGPRPTPAKGAGSPPEEETFIPLNPTQLTFQKWEDQDIYRLWPLFRTPRSVKRFVNIYRLLRAGLPTGQDVAQFEGTEEQPGQYQQALLLLAVVTAFPNDATRFLYRLDDWLASKGRGPDRPGTWQEFVSYLRSGQGDKAMAGSRGNGGQRSSSRPETLDKARSSGQNAQIDVGGTIDEEDGSDLTWRQLLEGLDQTVSEGFKQPFDRTTVRDWSSRVARFSFSVHPIGSVDREEGRKDRQREVEESFSPQGPLPI